MIYEQTCIYKNSDGNNLSLNLNDYNFESLIDDINYLNGFNRRGTINEFVRYYEDLSILSINLFLKNNSPITANDWVDVFTLVSNKFWFSDFDVPEHQPIGPLGINSGTMLTIGLNSIADTNKNLLLTTLTTGDGRMAYKDIYLQENNYGVVINRAYSVVKK